MRSIIAASLFVFAGLYAPDFSYAQKTRANVRAYTRSDGTYVRAHTRGCPGGVCGGGGSGGGGGGSGLSGGSTYAGLSSGSIDYGPPAKCGLWVHQMHELVNKGSVTTTKGNCHIHIESH